MTDISKATVEQVIASSIRRGIGPTEPILQIARAQVDRIAVLEVAMSSVIGMLDDPTGAEHVRDMRGATVIARAALIPSNPAASGLDVEDV